MDLSRSVTKRGVSDNPLIKVPISLNFIYMFRNFIASQFRKPTGLFGIFTSNMMMKRNQEKYNILIKNLNLRPNEKILEIGYGPGIGIHMIAGLCESCTIHGIDFSRLMYKKAGRYNKPYVDNGKVKLQYGNFLEMRVDETEYDKIFCLNVVYFWDELSKPFEKIRSLLKNGGVFSIYMVNANTLIKKKTPDSVFNKYTIDQIVDALRSAGFIDVEHFADKGYYVKAKK
jgi:ubiquinone/menaquinone biosynthesis C-methylase UbiE